MKKIGTGMTVFLVAAVVSIASVAGTFIYLKMFEGETLMISTTTSLYDTGLLDFIEYQYEAEHKVDLRFISVGTGIAILHAQRGDADLILVHDPSLEFSFLQGGYGVCRKIIAYNFFAIVGPETDPAKIQGLSPVQALTKIVESGRNGTAKWISRGDNSGTHAKEKSLWAIAGFSWQNIRNEAWFIESGTGMGATLQAAYNLDAYTLADMGTYLTYFKNGLITLKVLVGQEKDLLNVYSAMAVNKTMHPHTNFDGSIRFIKFLASEEGQQIISQYGQDEYGQSLFYGAVNILKNNTDPTLAEWIRQYAFFNGSECPPEYQDDHPELYA